MTQLNEKDIEFIKELRQAKEDGTVDRRDLMKAAGALGLGGLIGGGSMAAATGNVSADASQSDSDPDIGEPNDRVDVFADGMDANSVNTDELLGIADHIFTGGESVSDINSTLSTSDNTVILSGDHSNLSDRLEITANNVTLVIHNDATVKLADGASPTQITDDKSDTMTPLIYAQGQNNISVYNYGVLDANNTNFSRGSCVFIKNATGGNFWSGPGGIVDAAFGIWPIDCEEFTIERASSRDYGNAVVSAEGCHGLQIDLASGSNGTEVVDLNGYNQHTEIGMVVGENNGDAVVDINQSPYTTVQTIRGHGTPTHILQITGGSGIRHSDRTATGNSNNVTVNSVAGTASDSAVFLWDSEDKPIKNATISGLDVKTSGAQPTIENSISNANVLDGLELEGYVENTGGAQGILLGDGGYEQNDLTLDVEVVAGNNGAQIQTWDNVSGHINAHDCAKTGVAIQPRNSGDTCDNYNLVINAMNNDVGVQVHKNGTATSNNFEIVARGNATTDVIFDSAAIDCDVSGHWDTRSDNGTRSVWNGLGYNSGDPSAGGDWNGNGREGIAVRDTTNADTYLYNNDVWSQIASA